MEKTIEQSAEQAEELAVQIRSGGIEKAFTAFDNAITEFEESGLDLDAVLPSETIRQLGIVTKPGEKVDGQAFWEVYKGVVIESICKEGSELNTSIKAALQSGKKGQVLKNI